MGEGAGEDVGTVPDNDGPSIKRCEMNDQPTQPAHSTAASAIPANIFPRFSSVARRVRIDPCNNASRSLRRRTATDSSS